MNVFRSNHARFSLRSNFIRLASKRCMRVDGVLTAAIVNNLANSCLTKFARFRPNLVQHLADFSYRILAKFHKLHIFSYLIFWYCLYFVFGQYFFLTFVYSIFYTLYYLNVWYCLIFGYFGFRQIFISRPGVALLVRRYWRKCRKARGLLPFLLR